MSLGMLTKKYETIQGPKRNLFGLLIWFHRLEFVVRTFFLAVEIRSKLCRNNWLWIMLRFFDDQVLLFVVHHAWSIFHEMTLKIDSEKGLISCLTIVCRDVWVGDTFNTSLVSNLEMQLWMIEKTSFVKFEFALCDFWCWIFLNIFIAKTFEKPRSISSVWNPCGVWFVWGGKISNSNIPEYEVMLLILGR